VNASSRCRSCHAPVRWVYVAPKMNRAPIDPEPAENGNMWVDHWQAGTPVMNVAANRAAIPRNVPLAYLSHFATCPQAKDWRKDGMTPQEQP